ncbi:LysR family transcriptional regulator [Verticiella sediminum]|uniref:LysR family transcriptional regulator n=1 Tax=Verticiella sediminum TaxID=1247510 RepID=A0A556A7H9_9BURK|nr:LysR family transcriptional regulator [Verticiella sediminum]TSH88828.1 LysR family transcriptional regulator [Verticiella sediminum]
MAGQRVSPDSLSGVGAFVAVVRAGSFTLAAERLGVTKSAVGKSINRLEERLGVKLIRRTTRRLQLTFDGEAYFQACSVALDGIAAAQAQITPYDQVLRGRVHIDMPMAFGKSVLLPILLEMAAPHPELALTMSFNDATVDLMRAEADLVIRFGRLPDSGHLVARKLTSQERLICGSPGYLQTHGVPMNLSDLNGHRCIVGTTHGPPQQWTVQDGGQVTHITPPATHQLSDGESIVETALAGFGLCQMPVSLLRSHIEQGRLVPVLQAYSGVLVDIHILWVRQSALAPRVRYVIDQLMECAERGELD